jgi:hypothetical protein
MRQFALLAVIATLAAEQAALPAPADLGPAIAAFTGARTRCAWVDDGRLVRLDSADGIPRTTDLGRRINRPVITPSGEAVIVICFDEWRSYLVDWDDDAARPVAEGRVTHVRRDDDGRESAYWQDRENAIRCAPLDGSADPVVVWKFPFPPREGKTENFSTSADGRRAVASVPWPYNATACLPQAPGRDFVILGLGCWPQIAPDNSYRVFHLYGGQHRFLALYDAAAPGANIVELDPHPDPRRQGANTPRWANDPRFLIAVDQGFHHERPSVHLGRFAADFGAIETWLRISAPGQVTEPACWLADLPPSAPATIDAERIVAADTQTNDWPADHTGLEFVWQGWARQHIIRDAEGAIRHSCLMRPRGRAQPYRELAAELAGGRLEAEGLPATFGDALRSAAGVSVELLVSPDRLAGTGTILHYGPAAAPGLVIAQDGKHLAVAVRGADDEIHRHAFGPLPYRREDHPRAQPDPLHLVLTIRDGLLDLAADGTPLTGTPLPPGGPAAVWADGPLTMGAAPDGGSDWAGRVEAMAIYSRLLPPALVTDHHARFSLRMTRRWPARAETATGRLVAMTPVPDLATIAPYPRSLVMYAYEVVKADGPPTRLRVAHWAWLDDTRVLPGREIGRDYPLVYEPATMHPQLRAERLDDDLEDAGTEFVLEVGR